MDLRLRIIPGVAFLGLLVARIVNPTFLATRIWAPVPITWFWVVFLVLGWLAAWAITPPFMHAMNVVAKRWFLPFAFFLVVLLGLVAVADLAWNEAVASWCTSCGHSHLLNLLMSAMTGGA